MVELGRRKRILRPRLLRRFRVIIGHAVQRALLVLLELDGFRVEFGRHGEMGGVARCGEEWSRENNNRAFRAIHIS